MQPTTQSQLDTRETGTARSLVSLAVSHAWQWDRVTLFLRSARDTAWESTVGIRTTKYGSTRHDSTRHDSAALGAPPNELLLSGATQRGGAEPERGTRSYASVFRRRGNAPRLRSAAAIQPGRPRLMLPLMGSSTHTVAGGGGGGSGRPAGAPQAPRPPRFCPISHETTQNSSSAVGLYSGLLLNCHEPVRLRNGRGWMRRASNPATGGGHCRWRCAPADRRRCLTWR